RKLDIALHYPVAAELPFDRADLLEVLGNLLDNACKWANQQVQLDLNATDSGWHIRISDDGPGIPAGEARTRALARGQRLDERRDGQGLGLAIAADIVNAWRGELRLEDATLGGLCVDITLPRRRP